MKRTSFKTSGPWRFKSSHFFLVTIYFPCLHEFNPSSILLYSTSTVLLSPTPYLSLPWPQWRPMKGRTHTAVSLNSSIYLFQPIPFPKTVHVRDRVPCHNESNDGERQIKNQDCWWALSVWFMKHHKYAEGIWGYNQTNDLGKSDWDVLSNTEATVYLPKSISAGPINQHLWLPGWATWLHNILLVFKLSLFPYIWSSLCTTCPLHSRM